MKTININRNTTNLKSTKPTRGKNKILRALCALSDLRVIFADLLAILLFAAPARAAEPVVHAVLFYSPTCGHCQQVITQDLPPLMEQNGEQLQIVGVDVTTEGGQMLYQAAAQHFQIPEERLGVPCLIVGDRVLVGSGEIPAEFPGIIATGLASGGIDWPDIPGLREALELSEAAAENSSAEEPPSEDTATVGAAPEQTNSAETSISSSFEGDDLSMLEKFALDPLGNGISVIVLLVMLASLGVLTPRFLGSGSASASRIFDFIPLFVLLGIAVAGYLSYIEVTHSEAVCGPVGDCNAVQSSPYAILFGILPVGVLGLVGFALIGVAWLLERFGPQSLRDPAALALWLMAGFGVLFSIYLTFLEPFMIGATCAWCISSAILITLILWAATGRAAQALKS